MANGRKLPSRGVRLKSGRWRLVTPLGEGAYGQTWLAQDNVTGEKVAIKVIPVESQQVDMLPFIKQEARMLQSVANECCHNHVVCYKAMVGAKLANGDDSIGLVMSMAPGTTINKIPQASEQTLRALARQLFGALTFLHGVGVIHRDVKPENVIVDDNNKLTLVDLGIACQKCADTYGGLMGTPGFIMPSLVDKMEAATVSDPVYIPKSEFRMGDMWSAAQTLLTRAKKGSPTAKLLEQLKRYANGGDKAGVQSVVARLT
jgi:serine/threonine protein kinase